jgi:methyl-accepting chemotaxis protein
MFNNLKLTPKIAGSIAITLLVTSSVGFFITQNRINKQAQDAFVDKLRKTDGMAGAVRTYFSANVDVYVPNHEFKQVKQVPVVVAWNIARDYAESQGMKFSTPSLHPRNPQHAPDDFEREALTSFESNSDLKEYFKRTVVSGQEVMRYAQPVRLTADCLFCHGDPAGSKDPLGYVKEGMKAGDLRGAFVVTAPLTAVQEAAMGNSLALLLLGVVTMLLAVAVVFFLVRRFVVKPVAEAAALANQIANNNLAVADIKVRAHDEIGEAGAALNKMKNNLHKVIQSIAGSAVQVASASEELDATSQQITANCEETSAQADVVSKAAETVSQNLQTVATGAEEMGASIKEIAKNATEAARVATAPPSKSPKPPLPPCPSWAILRPRSGRSLRSSRRSPSRPTCWRSMPPSKPPARARRARALPWSPTK